MSTTTLTCQDCGKRDSVVGETRDLLDAGWTEHNPDHCETCECCYFLCPGCTKRQPGLAMRPVRSTANEEAVRNAVLVISEDAGCSVEAVVRRVYQRRPVVA